MQSGVDRPTAASSEPNIGDSRHVVQRNQMLQLRLSFPLTVIPRCFNTYLFFSCFTSSRVEILRACAGSNDGRTASFDLILCLRFALSIPRHTYPPSLSCLLYNSLQRCQYLLQ